MTSIMKLPLVLANLSFGCRRPHIFNSASDTDIHSLYLTRCKRRSLDVRAA